MIPALEALDGLLAMQDQFERGPKREGAFALWLVCRVALDLGSENLSNDKAELRRLELLERRVAPLAVPRPLAKGLSTALAHLREAHPTAARIALSQLVAPARDALGEPVAEFVALMARELHQLQFGEGESSELSVES